MFAWGALGTPLMPPVICPPLGGSQTVGLYIFCLVADGQRAPGREYTLFPGSLSPLVGLCHVMGCYVVPFFNFCCVLFACVFFLSSLGALEGLTSTNDGPLHGTAFAYSSDRCGYGLHYCLSYLDLDLDLYNG